MYKILIKSIQKVRHQATDKDFLDVELQVFPVEVKEGVEPTPVLEQKHALPVESTQEEVQAFAEKILAGFVRDEEIKEKNKESDAINKNVEDLQKELVGSEIKIKEEKPKNE